MAAAGRKRAVGRGRGRARSRRCQRGHPRPAAGPGSGGSPREPPGVRLPPALLPALLPVPGAPGGWRQAGCAGCAAPGAASFPCQASSCGTVPRERASGFALKRALAAFARSSRPRLLCFPAGSLLPAVLPLFLCPAASSPPSPGLPQQGLWLPSRLGAGSPAPAAPLLPPPAPGGCGRWGVQRAPKPPRVTSCPAGGLGCKQGATAAKGALSSKKKNSEGTSCRLELRICAATPSKQGVSSALLLHPLFGGP